MDFIKRKLKFTTDQLNVLKPYREKTIQEIKKDYKELKFIDSVSFRNEIVHSYDVNVYLVWSKRNIDVVIRLYKGYVEKILLLLRQLSEILK